MFDTFKTELDLFCVSASTLRLDGDGLTLFRLHFQPKCSNGPQPWVLSVRCCNSWELHYVKYQVLVDTFVSFRLFITRGRSHSIGLLLYNLKIVNWTTSLTLYKNCKIQTSRIGAQCWDLLTHLFQIKGKHYPSLVPLCLDNFAIKSRKFSIKRIAASFICC